VIDLGPPDDGAARRKLGVALAAAGLDPVMGDGVEDALAGIPVTRDDAALAAEITEAGRAFGELHCATATEQAERAIGRLATRQAAGMPVPELPRSLAYVLLCADRSGDANRALVAAAQLRAVGGSPEVPAAVLSRYPEVDSSPDREVIELEITTAQPGAAVWVDFAPAGTTPLHLTLTAGEHIVAAASGTRRGYVVGTATHQQKAIEIPLAEMAGTWSALAARVASWHGAVPSADELAAALAEVKVRVALIRHGDAVEAWGHAGVAEPVRLLGGADGTRTLAEAERAAALIADRVQAWTGHAPDPDRPLLVESAADRTRRGPRGEVVDTPTSWAVYVALAGAVLGGALVIYLHETSSSTQRVELHYP
jgi:hypothetical protein